MAGRRPIWRRFKTVTILWICWLNEEPTCLKDIIVRWLCLMRLFVQTTQSYLKLCIPTTNSNINLLSTSMLKLFILPLGWGQWSVSNFCSIREKIQIRFAAMKSNQHLSILQFTMTTRMLFDCFWIKRLCQMLRTLRATLPTYLQFERRINQFCERWRKVGVMHW